MVDRNTVVFGILIVLVFIWRFARTRQIYLVSLDVQAGGSDPISFSPDDLPSFFSQVLLGHRSLTPTSFFIRGFVFLVVAVGLLPFKDYEPTLYLLCVVLIGLYVPWCIAHGLMLKKNIPDDGAN
jgi:membrane-bound metal-dependent hydrolase YbcI (DUF457 family)